MKIYFSVLLAFLAINTYGQKELPSGQIEVIKDYEVKLIKADKIRIIPQPAVRDTSVRVYTYQLNIPSPAIEYHVPQLIPLAIEPEQKPVYYPLYAKAGYGSPNSFLGLVSYDRQIHQDLAWGIDLRHLSANNKKIPLQKFSDTQGQLDGSMLVNSSMLLEGYINGRFEKVYFYSADIPANPEALKRSFNRYDANFSASNTGEENASFRYKTFLRYMHDKDDHGTSERTLLLGGDASISVTEKQLPLGVMLTADLSRMSDIEVKTINNILAEPYFEFHSGDFKIHLGALALLKTEENKILPSITASYNILPLITLHAGWKGIVSKNNFHALSTVNPYIVTRLDEINNMISNRIFAGVHGVAGNFNFEFSGTYTRFENMAFFLQDVDREEQFLPIYDDGSYVGVQGSLNFEILKHVTLRGEAFGKFYSLDNEEKPWHKPSFGLNATAAYNGGDDIYHVAILFHAENGLPYRTTGGTVGNLDALLNLSLHGDYYFTQSIGGFVELNNILGNNRERWSGYPTYGFNAKAGLTVRL